MKKIEWNKVTWYSKIIALIVFIGVFFLGFYIGMDYDQTYSVPRFDVHNDRRAEREVPPAQQAVINSVVFSCDQQKTIGAKFMQSSVTLVLSDGRAMTLPHTISADGARYANADESFVFWNKGNTAIVQEGTSSAYQNCVVTSQTANQ